MKVKKLFPLASVALLSVVALTGCGGNKGGNGGEGGGAWSEKIMIWAAEQEKPVINTVIGNYNKTAKTKIRYEILAVEEKDTASNFTQDVTQKNAPDLFLTVDDKLQLLEQRSAIMPLNKTRFEGFVKENNLADAVEASTIGNNLYGFPICSDNGYFLWYDKTQLTDVSNLNTMLETLKAKGKTMWFNVDNGYYVNSFFMPETVCGTGSMQWARENKPAGKYYYEKAEWDSPKGVATAEAVSNLLAPYYAVNNSKTLVSGNANDETKILNELGGKMAAAVGGVWLEKELTKKLGDKLGAAKLPTFTVNGETHQLASFNGTKLYCINKSTTTAKKNVAAVVGQLLTSKEAQLIRFEKRAINPCNKEAVVAPEYVDHKSIGAKAFLTQKQFSCPQNRVSVDTYWQQGEIIGRALLTGKLTDDGTALSWKAFLSSKMEILKSRA